MMKLPTNADLNEVAQGLHGMDFAPLPNEFKLDVVKVAQAGVLAYTIDNLPVELSIHFAECLAEYSGISKIAEQLQEIDASLGPIMDWFHKSRLYEP